MTPAVSPARLVSVTKGAHRYSVENGEAVTVTVDVYPDGDACVIGAEEALETGGSVPVDAPATERWAEDVAVEAWRQERQAERVARCPDAPVHVVGCTCND